MRNDIKSRCRQVQLVRFAPRVIVVLLLICVARLIILDRIEFNISFTENKHDFLQPHPHAEGTTHHPLIMRPPELHSNDLKHVGRPGLRRNKNDGAWYSIAGENELYVYSAHYDTRVALQGPPEVRVIGVSQYEHKTAKNLYCLLWNSNKKKIKVKAELTEIGAGIYFRGNVYVEFVITCRVNNHPMPTHVSILTSKNEPATFAVPVERAVRYETVKEIGICMSLSYWDLKPHRLVEWLEFQRLMGVATVIVYNNSLSLEAQKVLTFYESHEPDFLILRQSRTFLSTNSEFALHLQMAPVINDCMYRYQNRFRAILVIDFDEFLVPNNAENFHQLITEIHTKHPEPHAGYVYAFRNAYFFNDFQPRVGQPKEMITLRYTRRAELSEEGYSAKSMIGTQTCIAMHNHYCWKNTPIVDNSFHYSWVEVEPELAVLHHYKHCHLEEKQCQKLFSGEREDQRILRFASKLKRAVSDKRVGLGMSPVLT